MSLWDAKARKWIVGRRNWEEKLAAAFSEDDEVVWFHCASLGEFEQGRPVIEEVRRRFPEGKVLLTFFSPSGYEKRKDYSYVDFVSYLPLDTRRNAKKFLEIVSVQKAIFIKYEFWYYFLNEISKRSVPLYLASGNFRPQQIFFSWYGKWYLKVLGFFTHIFVQGSDSEVLLRKHGITEVSVAGDTRFDRVLAIAEKAKEIESVRQFVGKEKVLIAGSTWEKDEKIIKDLCSAHKNLKLILAPHEPTESNIERLRSWFPAHVLFSDLNNGREQEDSGKDVKVLIVNTIGHLSSLYKYGTIAYIGGGFGKGIHNILEASAAGLPVMFGQNYKRFREAVELNKAGGAFGIKDEEEAFMFMSKLMNEEAFYLQSSDISREYTKGRVGATKLILDQVF